MEQRRLSTCPNKALGLESRCSCSHHSACSRHPRVFFPSQALLHTATRLEAAYPLREFSTAYVKRRAAGAVTIASHPTAAAASERAPSSVAGAARAAAVAAVQTLPPCGEVTGAVLPGWRATVSELPEEVTEAMRNNPPPPVR